MQQSSFCGICSLKTSVVTIGLFHLMSAPLLLQFLDPPGFSRQFWIPFLVMLIPLSVLFLLGVEDRNPNHVFPFVSMQFIMILMLICFTFRQMMELGSYIFVNPIYSREVAIEMVLIALLTYFFLIVFTFYEELYRERFTSSLSIEDSVNKNGVLDSNNILNNLTSHQKKENNIEKQAIILCCEDLEKSILVNQ